MLNISLPDQIRSFVEEQAALAVTAKPRAAGFNSANAYVYHLIVQEQERLAQQERIESLLLEGLESGERVEADICRGGFSR